MKSKRKIHPYIFTGFFICLLLVLGSFKIGILKGNVTKKQSGFPVQSRVSSVAVVESTLKDSIVYMIFRNDSKKTITAYSIGSGGSTDRIDLLNTPDVVPSGATFVDQFALSEKTKIVYLQSVIYDDGSGEGVPKYIQQFQDARAGKQAQLQRILPIFQDSLTVQSAADERWQKNVLKLQNLPEREEGKSSEYNAALQDEKNLALMRAGEYEQIQAKNGAEEARHLLNHLKESYEGKKKALSVVLKQR